MMRELEYLVRYIVRYIEYLSGKKSMCFQNLMMRDMEYLSQVKRQYQSLCQPLEILEVTKEEKIIRYTEGKSLIEYSC